MCVYPICVKLIVIIQFYLVNYFLKKLPYQGNDNFRTLWLAESRKLDPSILRKHPVHFLVTLLYYLSFYYYILLNMTLSCKVFKQSTNVTPILSGDLFHEIATNK